MPELAEAPVMEAPDTTEVEPVTVTLSDRDETVAEVPTVDAEATEEDPDDGPPDVSDDIAEEAEIAADAPDTPEALRTDHLPNELNQAAVTLSNIEGRAVLSKTSEMTQAAREDYFAQNPGQKALRDLLILRTMGNRDFTGQRGLNLTSGGSGLVVGEHTVLTVWKSAEGNFTCQVEGAKETVTIAQSDLITALTHEHAIEIVSSFPDRARTRELIQTYIDSHEHTDVEGGLTDEQRRELPSILESAAIEYSLLTPADLKLFAQKQLTHEALPADGESRRSQVEQRNMARTAMMEQVRQRLDGRNLATAEDVQGIFSDLGIDRSTIQATIESAREAIPQIQAAIKNAPDAATRDRLKATLATTQATIEVYTEALPLLEGDVVHDFMDKVETAQIPTETRAAIKRALRSGDIDALIQMAAPEASVGATAEEIEAARMRREKLDKALKGVGMAGGLIALLIVLGLVSGTKG